MLELFEFQVHCHRCTRVTSSKYAITDTTANVLGPMKSKLYDEYSWVMNQNLFLLHLNMGFKIEMQLQIFEYSLQRRSVHSSTSSLSRRREMFFDKISKLMVVEKVRVAERPKLSAIIRTRQKKSFTQVTPVLTCNCYAKSVRKAGNRALSKTVDLTKSCSQLKWVLNWPHWQQDCLWKQALAHTSEFSDT